MTAETQPTDAATQKTVDGIPIPAGIIIPPPDVRSVVEKTAAYVVRNGRAFEARIRENEQTNSKFNFIKFNDPYFAYYEWRLKELETGGPAVGGSGDANPSAKGASSTPAATKDTSGLAQPEPLEFTFKLPPISAQDFDVIKLTALYVARNGTQFQSTLARAESRNFQYDFLRPTHTLYPLFTSLVEQYKRVITPSPQVLAKIESGIKAPYAIINKARVRAEWTTRQELQTQKAAEEAKKEREAYAQIDWHDFVVVENIRFTEADERSTKLPAPLSKAQLEYASLEQKRMGSLRLEEAPPDFENEKPAAAPPLPPQPHNGTPAPPARHNVPASLPNPPRHLPSHPARTPAAAPSAAPPAAATGPPGMKIKSAGTSRLNKLKSYTANSKEPMVASPITGELIPQSQLGEHMRITLIDPKWKEQKNLADSRQSTTNLSTSEVAANIKRLIPREGREDDEEEDEDVEPPRKKARDIQWDGYSRSKGMVMQQAAAEATPQQISEAKKREMERLNKIGPTPKPK